MANTYTYSGPATRWSEGDPTAVDYLNVSRVNSDHLYEALNTIIVSASITAGAATALKDGTTATTQGSSDNSTKIATTAWVTANATTSPGGSNTQIQYNNSGAFGGSANLAWTNGTSTLAVAGTANAKMLNISASGAALGSQNASKIILVDLNDPATMWDVKEFLARARFTSWYQASGAPPMRGAVWIEDDGEAVVWWNLDTDVEYMKFSVSGTSTGTMIGSSSANIADLDFLDGVLYLADDANDQAAMRIDFMRDEMRFSWSAGSGLFKGNISERNSANGYTKYSDALVISNNYVHDIAATRDTSLIDEFNRPVHWWSIGTTGGACLYNPHNDAIYDWHDSNRTSTRQFLMNDKWLFMRNQTTYQGVNYIQMSGVIADQATVITHFQPWNSADGSNRYQYSMPWDKSATITGIAGNYAASQVYIASTQGLCRITFPAEDNIYGWIWTTSTYQTPFMKGERVAAYPLNDLNDRSKGTGQTLTNNNSVTFATGGPTGNYADFVAASSQSLTLADHANFTGMTELSLSCWFKRDIDSGGNEGLINKSDNGTASDRSFGLYIGGGDVIEFFTRTGAQVSCYDHGITIALAQWYHVVGTYDGANMKLFLNGTLIHTAAQTGTITDSGEIFVIGARTSADSPQHFFDGQIAGVYVGATAMTESEVKLEHQRGVRVLGGATTKLANTDVKSVQVDPDTGLAAVTTAANQTEIWDIETGLRQSIDGTTTATVADADVALKTGATLPEYITARNGAIEFDGQTRSVS